MKLNVVSRFLGSRQNGVKHLQSLKSTAVVRYSILGDETARLQSLCNIKVQLTGHEKEISVNSAALSRQGAFRPEAYKEICYYFAPQATTTHLSSISCIKSPDWLKRPVVGRQTTTDVNGQTTEEHLSLLPQMSNFPERDEKASNCVQSNRAREE